MKKSLSLLLAASSLAACFAITAVPASAAAVSYSETFENATSVSGVSGLSIVGGNASIVKDGANSVLKVTGGEKVSLTIPAATTKDVVEVSYKMKFVNVGSGNWNSFAAMKDEDEVAAAFRIGKEVLQYISTAGTINNQRLMYCEPAQQDGLYREVKYKIDFKNNRVYTYLNGDGSIISAHVPVRTTGVKGVNKVYFDVPTGDVIYFDDIKIKEESLEITDAYPKNNSKNYKMGSSITLNLSAQVLSEYLTKDYIQLYENDKSVSNYTISQPKNGEIVIKPAEGFSGNSTYKIVIKEAVNSSSAQAIAPAGDIVYQITTNGFLVSTIDDATYGGRVFVNGKKYKYSAKYENSTTKTQKPVVLIATSKNGKLQDVELKEGYTVNVGETKKIEFTYTANGLDETTKVTAYLWDGVDTMIPLAESTTAQGEYADGTPVYEAELLQELQTRYQNKNISGFKMGVIADVQPAIMTGYKNFLHHYGSIAKASNMLGLDMLADLGDSINHSYDKQLGMDMLKQQSEIMQSANVPVVRVPGNHDDNRGVVNDVKDATYFITREDWVNACDADWATVMDGSTAGVKPYYYKDFDEDKIRVIALDSLVTPFAYNASDTDWKFGFSVEEVKWLAEEALNFSDKADKDGWGIVIFSHVIGGGYNNAEMQKIIKAFIDGTSGSVTSNGEYEPITEAISYDFTAQGPHELICSFQGHYHADKDGSLLGKPLITVNSSLPDTDTDPDRELKTATEDAWDIVTIDRTNRKIYCTRFGAGEDREFSY